MRHESIVLHGLLSSGYSHNLNMPSDRKNRFHTFDVDDDNFTLHLLELCPHRDANEHGDAGFRIDVLAGSAVTFLPPAAGLTSGDITVLEAICTYIIPLENGVRVDAGKFLSPFGYELIDGYDGFNDNYSKGFLFSYAVPQLIRV